MKTKTSFGLLALTLLAGLAIRCQQKCSDCHCTNNCPAAGVTPLPVESRVDPRGGGGDDPLPDGGVGACTDEGCQAVAHPCSIGKCMANPLGTPVCEFAPKLTGKCRCHVGDKRNCGGAGLVVRTCLNVSSSETKWTNCP